VSTQLLRSGAAMAVGQSSRMWFGLSLACMGDLLGCWLIAGKSILSDIGSLPVICGLLFRSQQPKSDNFFNAINGLI